MDASGSLDLLIERLLGSVRSVLGLVAATMAAGGVTIALTSPVVGGESRLTGAWEGLRGASEVVYISIISRWRRRNIYRLS